MAAISSFLIGGCLSIALATGELKERHGIYRRKVNRQTNFSRGWRLGGSGGGTFLKVNKN